MIQSAPHWLLIDIDETLLSARDTRPIPDLEHRLLELMRRLAIRQGRSHDEVTEVILRSKTAGWWEWATHLRALGLDPEHFWRTADRVEKRYSRPTDPALAERLGRLRDAGYRLAITSNNPCDGIRHKLRLAGIDTDAQNTLLDEIIGTDVACAMKWDAVFWEFVLIHLGITAAQATVIGDNPHDDLDVPQSIGIRSTVLLANALPQACQHTSSAVAAADWEAAESHLLLKGGPLRSPTHVVA